MCGRFALSAKSGSIEKLLPNIKVSYNIKDRYNIAPTQAINIITKDNSYEIKSAVWGLIPSWAKDESIGNKMINARAETIFEKPAFKNLINRKRCLIVASGYYEWQAIPGQSRKQPYFIYLKNEPLLTFAGLWDVWKSPNGELIHSATIITCEPNEKLKHIHNRMPVIITGDQRENWLDSANTGDALRGFLDAIDGNLVDFHPVSFAVNNPSNDNMLCSEPIDML